MKFKIAEKHRYWWPVVVRIPDPDNAGKLVEQKLKILFEPQGRDEAIAAEERYAALATPRERAEHEHAQLIAVVKGWDDVEDADSKEPVPFSVEIFAQALQQLWFRSAVYQAYNDSLSGREAEVGN